MNYLIINMNKRRKTVDTRELEKKIREKRNQRYTENKNAMLLRRKLNLPRARYKKNSQGENNIEIWIGDAVNWCIKCDNPLVWSDKIGIVVDILDENRIKIHVGGQKMLTVLVDKIRFDHRLKKYPKKTFKRVPHKY